MTKRILILGDSGTGKSSSLRNLPSNETFVINVEDKPLPFKGWRTKYKASTKENPNGNYFSSDSTDQVAKIMTYVSEKRPEIKYLVIDDFGYIIMNQFMRHALEKGYEKYNMLGKQVSDLIELMKKLRGDLFVIVTMHVEIDKNGRTKPRTIGDMLDKYVMIEGKFTYVLHTVVYDGCYKLLTNTDNTRMAKTPMGCFDEKTMDNDLMPIMEIIDKYENFDEDINF